MFNPYDINNSQGVMAEYGKMLAVIANRYDRNKDKKQAASTILAVRQDMDSYMRNLQKAMESTESNRPPPSPAPPAKRPTIPQPGDRTAETRTCTGG